MHIYIIIILILIILVIYFIYNQYETYINYNAEYLAHKTKSFDSEKQILNMYGEDEVWRAQPSKSFDSEMQNGWLGKTIKYY